MFITSVNCFLISLSCASKAFFCLSKSAIFFMIATAFSSELNAVRLVSSVTSTASSHSELSFSSSIKEQADSQVSFISQWKQQMFFPHSAFSDCLHLIIYLPSFFNFSAFFKKFICEVFSFFQSFQNPFFNASPA